MSLSTGSTSIFDKYRGRCAIILYCNGWLPEVIMKRILVPFIFVIVVLFMTSCDALVTPVAYTRFDAMGSQVVVYTSHEFGSNILVFSDSSKTAEQIMEFQFNRCLGADTLNEKEYTVVALDDNQDLYVLVSRDYYPELKDFYLNGTKLVPTDQYHYGDKTEAYFFKSISNSLIRTNPNGSINPDLVNYIEYR